LKDKSESEYCYVTTNLTDYIGIDESDVGSGNAGASKYYPLFPSCSISEFYLKVGGNDKLDCNSIDYACVNIIGTNMVG
jgi:hypothetical protein